MRRVLFYDTTDSTNRRLQEAALDPSAPSGLTAVTDRQTEGRGRRGRSFYSPSGSGIYLSMLVRPAGTAQHTDPGVWTSVTARVSVAVCDAVEAVCRIRPGIKWVNDLLAGGRKVCGILTQMDMESETGDIRDIIVGIGINVQGTAEDLPEELRGTAGFLSQSADRPVPRTALAAEIIRRLDALFAVWPDGHAAALEQYRKDSLVIGREIRVITGTSEKKAIAEAVGDDFALHVRYEDGTREALRGGEITLRLT